ncbi:MAG: hypothetical protein KF914_15235 [Rhizobiaceae bacterium]|nr:hypothetical protein [Rhizobiaceae bacterium]
MIARHMALACRPPLPYMELMDTGAITWKFAAAVRFGLVLAAFAAASAPAAADTLSERIGAERIVRQRNIDLDIARGQLRRENFGRQQQILRETDRVQAPQVRQGLDVPKVRRTCQIRIDGNVAIGGRSCR